MCADALIFPLLYCPAMAATLPVSEASKARMVRTYRVKLLLARGERKKSKIATPRLCSCCLTSSGSK